MGVSVAHTLSSHPSDKIIVCILLFNINMIIDVIIKLSNVRRVVGDGICVGHKGTRAKPN